MIHYVALLGIIILAWTIYIMAFAWYTEKKFTDGTHNREPKLKLEYDEFNRKASINMNFFYACLGVSIPLFLGQNTQTHGQAFLIASAFPFILSRSYEWRSSRRFYWLHDWERRRLGLPSERKRSRKR